MRAIILGASALGIAAARELLDRGHEVVIIDLDTKRIEKLSDELDCGFISGDGTRPAVLRQVEPSPDDVLMCLTETDQDNILASLVGRTLGFDRVVTKVEDPDFEPVCTALELDDTIIPTREAARLLAGLCEGDEPIGLTATVKGDVRFFRFKAGDSEETKIEDLDLPEDTYVVAISNEEESRIAPPGTKITEGDEVLLVTVDCRLDELAERFSEVGTQDDERQKDDEAED